MESELVLINQFDRSSRMRMWRICEVEVVLTILKLTQTGRGADGRAQVSIGMHAHPKILHGRF